MTVKQAAARLEVSPGTVYDLISAGMLPCHRLGVKGRKIVIDPADVEAYWQGTRVVGRDGDKMSFKLKHIKI